MNKLALKIIFLLLLITISPLAASQQVDDANSLTTLQDYLSYAALNSAQLKASFENWKAALEQIPQAKSLDDPKFTFGYFIEEVETRVGPQKNKFGIMQTFPWFGEIEAKTGVASAKAKAARQKYEAAKLTLFSDVKNAFFEFSYLGISIDIAKENLELLKHFEEVARAKYRASSTSHPDIIRAQMELAIIEDVLNSLEKLREPTEARVNSILNRKSNSSLQWPQRQEPIEVELIREILIEKIVSTNPELVAMDWQTEAARAGVELAKTNFYPDIGVGIDWVQTDDAITSGVKDSGKDAVTLMFSLNIPIWRDGYKAAERQAKANVRKYQHRKVDMQNKKIYEALQVIYDIENSKRKINLYGSVLVAKAEELVQSSESSYRAGTIDFLSLIDAQRTLLKYKLNYYRAIADNQQSIAKLEALTGEQF